MKNFLITSTGRTATKWLANLMNQSELWSVYHEPRGYTEDTWEQARKYFGRDYYGEVNGALCLDFYKVPYKKAVIRRDTKELALSFANRYSYPDYFQRIKMLKERNDIIRSFRPMLIDFQSITTDLDCLRNLFKDFGITDYIPTQADLDNVVNANKEIKYASFNDLPQPMIDAYFKAQIKEL